MRVGKLNVFVTAVATTAIIVIIRMMTVINFSPLLIFRLVVTIYLPVINFSQ